MTRHDTNRRLIAAASLGVLAFAAACSKPEARAEEERVMTVGPENIFVVAASELRSGPALNGTLQPEEQASLRAEVPGSVLQVMVEQGESVRRGQPIARIDDAAIRDATLSARTNVATAQINVDNVRRQRARTQALAEAGAVAERDVENVRAAVAAAEAQLANARAFLTNAEQNLAKTVVRAPFDGVVSVRNVSPGDVIAPGAPVATVVRPSTMRLEAQVPAEQLAGIRVGAPVDFTVTGYPGRRFQGRVTRVSPVADPVTRQVKIIVSLPNSGGTLVGGLYAEGRVAAEQRTAPVIPAASIDESGVRPTVMTIKQGRATRVEIALGVRDADSEQVEVRTGLVPGDTVLVGAARGISPATAVRVMTTENARR